MQETLISAYKHLEDFDGKNPKGWLTKIAANKCRDYFRRGTLSLTEFRENDLPSTLPARESDPEAALLRKEARMHLHQAIEKLRPPYRETMKLLILEELTVKEIANRMNAPVKTVQTRCLRGKKMLRNYYKEVNSE